MSNFEVIVIPSTNRPHLMQIYAGLSSLCAKGRITLGFAWKAPSYIVAHSNLLAMRVRQSGARTWKMIVFDMEDSGRMPSAEVIRNCDLYFKRSFSEVEVKKLEPAGRKKVRPFGLNFCVISDEEQALIARIGHELAVTLPYAVRGRTSFVAYFKMMLRVLGSRYNFLTDRHRRIPPERRFLFSPEKPKQPRILFQTRLWHESDVPNMNSEELYELNQGRANVVRCLRREFGDRFVGGLQPTMLARELYPDLVVEKNVARLEYLQLVHSSLIAVTTVGLFGSTGGKLPEMLAASCCIVTEPLEYELPEPLGEPENILTFATPDECVAHVASLLEDDQLAQQMREANFKYYLEHVSPGRLVESCLRKVVDSESSRPNAQG